MPGSWRPQPRSTRLLDIAQANIGDAAGTYVAADTAAAGSYPGF